VWREQSAKITLEKTSGKLPVFQKRPNGNSKLIIYWHSPSVNEVTPAFMGHAGIAIGLIIATTNRIII